MSKMVPSWLQICCAEPLMQHPALRDWLRRPLELRQETVRKAKQRLKVGLDACSSSSVGPLVQALPAGVPQGTIIQAKHGLKVTHACTLKSEVPSQRIT